MRKSEITTKANAVFLATVLVAGIIALTYPSFSIAAQAQEYGMDPRSNSYESDYGKDNSYNSYEPTADYGMKDDKKYNSYESDYGKDKSYNSYEPDHGTDYRMASYGDKQSYGKDNSYDKSKDSSSVIVKKIKCNNINVNLNGLEISTLPPTTLNGLATEAQAADEGERGASGGDGRSSGHDSDFRFVCINNNNNNAGEDGENGDGTDGCAEAVEDCFADSLTVTELATLTAALASEAGVTVPIAAEILVFHSFADICEQLADRSATDVQFIISELIQNAGLTIHPDTVAAIVACISLALEADTVV